MNVPYDMGNHIINTGEKKKKKHITSTSSKNLHLKSKLQNPFNFPKKEVEIK